ncbi:MAG: succinate dehydrogenase cytochrome b subunit [Planctomycetota bacterium]
MIKSSIGCKSVMAVTGLLLSGFVLAHMLGNLQVFLGPEAYNTYAHKMQSLGPLLWVGRLGLLAILVSHVGAAMSLARENPQARPTRYVFEATVQATYASRTMVMTGVIILLFIVYHLLHFTIKATGAPGEGIFFTLKDGEKVVDVYSFMILSFRVWYIVLFYILGQVVLAVHLSHGVSSMFQTFGLKSKRYAAIIDKIGPAFAFVILAGNLSMPLACFTQILKLPGEMSAGGML